MFLSFRKVISCSLAPNLQSDDARLASKLLFSPWIWQRGTAVNRVEQWFSRYFKTGSSVAFNSGRAALWALLRSFGIGAGDEVLLQAFTCVAVPNSVLWCAAKPIYVDADETLNIDPVDLEKKISPRTKAIIVQHTFGIPAAMTEIVAIALKYNLILIEDCAHALGATYKGKKLGNWGDAAFFSFGRDKVISSTWGGVAIVNNKCQKFPRQDPGQINIKYKLQNFQKKLPIPGHFWIFRQLLHPLAFSLVLASYNIGIGKALLVILQKLKLLSLPVYPCEKKGKMPKGFPAKLPNALAVLLIKQLEKLDQYNQNRLEVAAYYQQALNTSSLKLLKTRAGAIFLRFPALVVHPQEMIAYFKKQGILLGNWYHRIIDPEGVDYHQLGYKWGSCPMAERIATRIINLPTRIPLNQAQRLIQALLKSL